MIKNFLNPQGHQNPISGSKVTTLLLKGWILPIGEVLLGSLRLQPAQQACLYSYANWRISSPFDWNEAARLTNLTKMSGQTKKWALRGAHFFYKSSCPAGVRNVWNCPIAWLGQTKIVRRKGRILFKTNPWKVCKNLLHFETYALRYIFC